MITVLFNNALYWKFSKAFSFCAFVWILLYLSSCASVDTPRYVEKPVGELYNAAATLLANGEYLYAARAFDEVERQHPYSIWASRAQLMAAYSYYRQGWFDEAILACERFLQLHPGSPDAPYAHYLAAISFYDQIVDVGRDQAMTRSALENLEQVILRYPETDYARDARLKIDLAKEHLAGKEMEIGRFYLKRNQYMAAISRFKKVISDYETTSHTPEALHRLTESYLSLGVITEAKNVSAVLGFNYPGSRWYQESYRLLAEIGIVDQLLPEDSDIIKNQSVWRRMVGFFNGE